MTATHDGRTLDIEPGDLRHVAQVQVKAEQSVDSRGKPTFLWSPDVGGLASVRCSIIPLSGRKAEISRQLEPTATHEIVTRYFHGMSAKKRLVFNGRIFNIGNMLNVLEQNVKLMFTCTEDQSGEST